MYECDRCTREFYSQHAVNQHMNALGHWGPQYECDTCVRKFYSQQAANQHMNALGHWEEFECQVCDAVFEDEGDASQHMNALNHWEHLYCKSCERGFMNENNLKMHLNSKIHRGSNVHCPFCNVSYTTASGVSHHLESGSCAKAKGLNRKNIYEEIKKRDPDSMISKKLLTYDFPQYEATNATWNGDYYECYICHRKFNKVDALSQHLNSPVHSEKLYHCPNRKCDSDFVSLAALFGHLESESCKFIRFEKVQSNVHDFIVGRQKLIGFV